MSAAAILLGPQRRALRVREAVDALVPPRAPVAAVTAGWEEREGDDAELRVHLGRPFTNLMVWQRVERIFAADAELFAAMRARQDLLREMQALYRLRLGGLLDPLHELCRRDGDRELLERERAAALAQVQRLDCEHRARVAAVDDEFDARWRPGQREAVHREQRELGALLAAAACLVIAGGHVGVLLHRLRLFDVLGRFGARPVVAWSAGAMVLCPCVVLFHDSPPQGSAHAEVLAAGCARVPDLVALPDARLRLRLDDRPAMRVFARRFAPSRCGLLDPGAWLRWDGASWSADRGSRMLAADGAVPEATP
jgi:hypothetical protein